MSSKRVMRIVGGCAAVLFAPSLHGCSEATVGSGNHWCANIENTPNRTTASAMRNSDPKNSDPKNSDPKNSDPKNSDPKNSDPNKRRPDKDVAKVAIEKTKAVDGSVFNSIKNRMPETLEISLGGRVADSITKAGCTLEYTVGASVDQCSGLNGISLVWGEWNVEETDGETIGTTTLELESSKITCTGKACASASACGFPSIDPTVDLSAGVTVNKASFTVAMKAVEGAEGNEGQWCFEVDQLALVPGSEDITYDELGIKFGALDFSIPGHVLTQVQDHLKMEQVFETLRDELSGALNQIPDLCFADDTN